MIVCNNRNTALAVQVVYSAAMHHFSGFQGIASLSDSLSHVRNFEFGITSLSHVRNFELGITLLSHVKGV